MFNTHKSQSRIFFHSLLGLLLCFVLMLSPKTTARETNEYLVKAAFLFNVARMVKWPDESKRDKKNQPIVFCFMGDRRFGERVRATIAKRRIRERQLRFIKDVQLQDVEQCHVLFIRESWQVRINEIFAKIENDPVLTVSDELGFLERGGMVIMQKEGKRLRLEVDLERVREHNIKISSRLLTLAKVKEKE